MTKRGNAVLVIGSGGREHAIVHKLSQSELVDKIYVAPGNGGTFSANSHNSKIQNLNISTEDTKSIVSVAKALSISLAVVGPENPLVNGLSDVMALEGIPCFGPTASAAKIESSKAWSKDFMKRNGIPTAKFESFTNYEELVKYLNSIDHRIVIKASGLAAGKGVLLPESKEEALQAAQDIMINKLFGEAGNEVVVEEFLTGEEVSILAFSDGVTAVCMPPAQDHKRVFDGDLGPNTGGMGAYAPAPVLTPELTVLCHKIVQDSVTAMSKEGIPFRGILYAGFMLTPNGPSVLEYNCRFGDPETQVLLPLLASDLYVILNDCVSGHLSPESVTWHNDLTACTVVLASGGYPGTYSTGHVISGLSAASSVPGATVYHAGTKAITNSNGESAIVTSGGRVLAVTGVGKSIRAAKETAYTAVKNIQFEGCFYRKDIANRAFTAPLRVGVLGSTRGSSLQAVLDAITAKQLNVEIVIGISNKREAGILTRVSGYGIPAIHIPAKKGTTREDYDNLVTSALLEAGVEAVLLVGYMRILSDKFVQQWYGKCLNVHPSLLPEFAGGMDMDVHSDVIKSGKTVTGCTVHVVTEVVDGGPILVQLSCPVLTDDTPDILKARVQALEGLALIQALEMIRTVQFQMPVVAATTATATSLTYKSAGVDIDAGEALVEKIKPMCKATRRNGCDASLGGFGGLFDLAQAGLEGSDIVLVSGTDGVGTKLKIAQAVGKHDTIGIDLVAMSVNDILVCGAEPLFFLDYYATGHLEVEEAAQVVSGIAQGCLLSQAALIGGETAEMAGMYAAGEYDLAGFCVGAVRRSKILPQNITTGDKLIGLTSSGVHSNGYSLVRKCVQTSGLIWSDPCPFQEGISLGEALLCPTKIYVKSLLPLIQNDLLKGMAHITGGGLLDNLPRVLPDDITAVVDVPASGWVLPPVFKWLQSIAHLPQQELLRTFNCGIGMVLVVDVNNYEEVLQRLTEAGETPLLLGELQKKVGNVASVIVHGDVL